MHNAIRVPEGFEFLKHLHILWHQWSHSWPMDKGVRAVVQPAFLMGDLGEVLIPCFRLFVAFLGATIKGDNRH